MNTKKAIALIVALAAGFFNPYPVRVAAAVAVLAVTANLLGMFAAMRTGEGVRGSKVLKGNLRIAIYFVCFAALYHVLRDDSISMRILSAVYTTIALFEFMIVIRKGVELGIIPRALIKKIEYAVSDNTTVSSGVQARQ